MLEMKFYKLRLDDETPYIQDCYAYAYCQEKGKDGDNPHIHMYIATGSPEQTIRSRVIKRVGRGNGKYSLKELDDEYPIEYLAYMLKEENWIKKDQYKNIPDEILKKVVEFNELVKDEMKVKKDSKKTVLQKMTREIQARIVDGKVLYENCIKKVYQPITVNWIIDFVVSWYRSEGTLIREFQLVSLVQTLSLSFIDGYAHELANRLRDKVK